MKLRIHRTLESILNERVNSKKERISYLGVIGFGISCYEKEEGVYYMNHACLTKDIKRIIEKDPKYEDMNRFVLENPECRIIPVFFSDSCVFSKEQKYNIRELKNKGYDVLLISGFSTIVYSTNKKNKFSVVDIVDSIPITSSFLSIELLKYYAIANSDNCVYQEYITNQMKKTN